MKPNYPFIILLTFSCAAFATDQGANSDAEHTAVQTAISASPLPIIPKAAQGSTKPATVPLEITDENITVMPPDEALKKPAAHFAPEQIFQFSKQVEKTLAAKGVHVAIVARIDQPASAQPDGTRYTHVAFAVYSQITMADGGKIPGYAMYNLYQEDKHPDTSALVQDFPVDFFAGVSTLEAGIIIPSPRLQQRLLDVINSPTYSTLHDPHYSLIANPYTLGCQNSAEHTLDVISAALYQTSNIKRIKANEIAYFKAQPVNINPIKLTLGSLFSAEISTSDQHGTPVTATFETIARFLQKYDKGSEVIILTP